jgi:hypothetical protein
MGKSSLQKPKDGISSTSFFLFLIILRNLP